MKRLILFLAFTFITVAGFAQAKLSVDSTAIPGSTSVPSIQWSRGKLYGKYIYNWYDSQIGKNLPVYSAQLTNYIFLGKAEAAALYQSKGNYQPLLGYTPANVNGANASGVWPVGITGNAVTVTNGIYTTGNYANPGWLTSLAYSKLTGAPTNVSAFTNDAGYITSSSLTGYVPYTGATADINLNSRSIQTTGVVSAAGFGATGLSNLGQVASSSSIYATTFLQAGSYLKQGSVTSSVLKADALGKLIAAVAGTDYATPGSVATGYVPYTGATNDLTLGAHSLTSTVNVNGNGVGGSALYIKADFGMKLSRDSTFTGGGLKISNIKRAVTSYSMTVSAPNYTASHNVIFQDKNYAGVVDQSDTYYIGTSALALNRAPAAQTLTGVTTDGNLTPVTGVQNQTATPQTGGFNIVGTGILNGNSYATNFFTQVAGLTGGGAFVSNIGGADYFTAVGSMALYATPGTSDVSGYSFRVRNSSVGSPFYQTQYADIAFPITAPRVYTHPDKSGTYAMTADIPLTQRLTASGNGVATTISIPHGLSGITTTSKIILGPNTSAAGGYLYYNVDATNANVFYPTPPGSGTGNLVYTIQITP